MKSLSFPSNTNDGLSSSININSDEIDPKYYAPTPSEHFNRSQRFNNNNITKDDLKIDFRTNQTGYLGNGNFSPSVFQELLNIIGMICQQRQMEILIIMNLVGIVVLVKT